MNRAVAVTTAAALIVVLGVTAFMVAVLTRADRSYTPVIPSNRCVAEAGEYKGRMTPEQAGNAAIIVGEAIRRDLPPRASSIALVTAWQESALRNLDYGDRDSLGLFQQRPSQGWGKPAQIMDPWYSSGKFYDALVKVKDWQTSDINDVAQAVQRSAFPEAYRQHEVAGRAWASALTGQTETALRCLLNDTDGGGGDELIALLTKVWGDNLRITHDGTIITIDAPDSATAWSVAQVSMAQLASYGFQSVQVGAWFLQLESVTLADWMNLIESPHTSLPVIPDQQVILTLL